MLIDQLKGHYNLYKQKSNQYNNSIAMKGLSSYSSDVFSKRSPTVVDRAVAQLGPMDRITMHKLIDKIQLQGEIIIDYPEYSIFIKTTGKDGNNIINKLSYNILTYSNPKDRSNPTAKPESLLANGKIIKDTFDRWYIKPELLPSDEINLTSYINEYNNTASTKFNTEGSIINALGAIQQDMQLKLAEGKESPFALGSLERLVKTFTEISEFSHKKTIDYGNKIINHISSEFSSQITLPDLTEIIEEYAEHNKNPKEALTELQKAVAAMKRKFNPPNPELRG